MSTTLPASSAIRVARPVYPRGLSRTLNTFIGFRARVRPPRHGRVILTLTASTVYRVFIDGAFLGYGPARAGHRHFRLDTYDLTDRLKSTGSAVAIEVAGYDVNSYYYPDHPSFLLAEITCGDDILAATGAAKTPAFDAFALTHRVQKAERFSYQRPFAEIYNRTPASDAWRTGTSRAGRLPLDTLPRVPLLPRNVPPADFSLRQPMAYIESAKNEPAPPDAPISRDRCITQISPLLKGFPEAELPLILADELQKIRIAHRLVTNSPYSPAIPLKLKTLQHHMVDFGLNATGFLGFRVKVRKRTRLVARVDEILPGGEMRTLDFLNAACWDLAPGTHAIECFEPSTFRYAKFLALSGDCEITGVYLRDYGAGDAFRGTFACDSEPLTTLFEASRETFRANAADLYTDCPHRERAGWMDNAFWMAPVEQLLTGRSVLGRNYFANFLHYELSRDMPQLPKGMMPMCYPADHFRGGYIPQWPFYWLLQLEGYLARTGDRALVDALEPRVTSLINDYFARFVNADGLLEKLDGWRFVEWSRANDLQDDVNYPTNMAFAAVLDAVARLYRRPALAKRAGKMRQVILAQSFDGRFFIDNALRKDGKLVLSGEHTEVCQYFAFAFGTVTPQSHPELWHTLLNDFGPQRKATGKHPNVYPANLINGIYLRLHTLTRYGHAKQVLAELPGYFLEMARATGTLWEHTDIRASCNHGCSSHVTRWILANATGVREIRASSREIVLGADADMGLAWFSARIPVADGYIEVAKTPDSPRTIRVPAGWTITPA